MTLFDLTILPLILDSGRELSELPGLHAASAPRKAARLRAQDQLILYLRIATTGSPAASSEGAAFTPSQQQEMLTRLAETYFTTSGSITAGLRAVVTRLNDFLLSRNLRSPNEGQIVASLTLAAIHSNTLLLAHAGSAHTFVITKTQVQHFEDGQGTRGLGVGKQAIPRFYQSPLEVGDLIVFCAEPPAMWNTQFLSGSTQLSLDLLRRRFITQAGGDLQAAVVKLQAGKGQLQWLRHSTKDSPVEKDAPEQITPQPSEEAPPVSAQPTTDVQIETAAVELPDTAADHSASAEEKPSDQPEPSAHSEVSTVLDEIWSEKIPISPEVAPINGGRVDSPVQEAPVEPSVTASERPVYTASSTPLRARPSTARTTPVVEAAPVHEPARPIRKVQSKPRPRRTGPSPAVIKISQFLRSLFHLGNKTKLGMQRVVNKAAASAFPERKEPVTVSPAAMLFIAICVPFVVVAVATAVYFNAGRSEQFAYYLYNAEQYAQQAAQQTDLQMQRNSWIQTLLWLDQAEAYDTTEESIALRRQAQGRLDEMDGIVRLAFQPVAQGGFTSDINVTKAVASLYDVYLLDSNQGRILRLYWGANGYNLDINFNCGPGRAGTQIIGPLIDLAVLPPNNNYRATVVGLDAGGNLVYCAPNQSGYDSRALTPPDTNWGKIEGMTTYEDMLYVLDPQVNAVWSYFGTNGVFENRPRLFFDNQVPQMADVIDMAVYSEFLYLLHANGTVTICEASGFEFVPTRCTDPAPFGDPRNGREPSPMTFQDAHFIQLQVTQPPDSSLFILDDMNKSIYHFSRQLNLQRQYRPEIQTDFPLPKDAPTTFVVTPNRKVVMAFGNQVFFAQVP